MNKDGTNLPDEMATATALILALFDERTSPEQEAELDRLIRGNPEVRQTLSADDAIARGTVPLPISAGIQFAK